MKIDHIPESIHDGYLRGLYADNQNFKCTVETLSGQFFDFLVDGLTTLCVNRFYAGNIILDARVVLPSAATAADVSGFFDSDVVPDSALFLSKLRNQSGALLLIDASYGAIVGAAFRGGLRIAPR